MYVLKIKFWMYFYWIQMGDIQLCALLTECGDKTVQKHLMHHTYNTPNSKTLEFEMLTHNSRIWNMNLKDNNIILS